MHRLIACLVIVFATNQALMGQFVEIPDFGSASAETPIPKKQTKEATDTIMFKEFNSLPGSAAILSYNYTNGSGYFFGTNYLDLDQDPNTPHQPGAQMITQGFIMDSLHPYLIEAVLLRVGIKQKLSPYGTPLSVSIQYQDGESTYSVNSGGTSTSYTIKAPGTGLIQASVPFDSIKAGLGTWYTRVDLPSPVLVNRNYFVVLDLADWYLNDDKIGLYASATGGASQIFGHQNILWLYPSPFLWVQINHIYSAMDRCIAIFPIINDGSGIDEKGSVNGIQNVSAYPNPCSDFITIQFTIDHYSDVVLSLIDQSGRTITEQLLVKSGKGTHEHSFDISGLPSAVYYYTIETNNGRLAKKFIKQ